MCAGLIVLVKLLILPEVEYRRPPRPCYAKKRGFAKNVLFAVRAFVCQEQIDAVTTNSATARSRKRLPTRTYQSHTAPRRCGVQETFQENGPTHVDSSSRRIQTVSGTFVCTARSKSIAMFSAFDPPQPKLPPRGLDPPFTRQRSAGRPLPYSQRCPHRARLATRQAKRNPHDHM